MARRLLFWLTVVFLLPSVAWAQVYEPGYVVRANGDTLRGEVENGFWTEPPPFIKYRRSAESPDEIFKPRQLRAVYLTGGRYFRFEALPIDHAAESRTAYIPHNLVPFVRVDSVLAEVLVEGTVTLLRVGRISGPHYLLLGANQPILDLSERKYTREDPNGAWRLADGNNYRGQLGVYFRSCPAAFSAVQTAPFTAAGLAAVVQTYNQACSSAKQAGRSWLGVAKPRRLMSLQGGVLSGLRYNRIATPDLTDPFLTAPDECRDCQVHPFGGLYIELWQPGRALAFYGELSAGPYRRQVWYLTNTATGSPTFSSVDYRAWLGTARLGLRYFVPLPHECRLFFGGSYELNSLSRAAPTDPNSPFVTQARRLDFASPTLLPALSAGWRSQRLSLAADGQFYEGPDPSYFNFFSSRFALRLSLGYQLGRNPDVAAPSGK